VARGQASGMLAQTSAQGGSVGLVGVRGARTHLVHTSYRSAGFGVREVAMATRVARPNQKFSRFGNILDAPCWAVHNSYSNPVFGVRRVALATRVARPNQKLSRFGTVSIIGAVFLMRTTFGLGVPPE